MITKICAECKWYKHSHFDSILSKCTSPMGKQINLVTGKWESEIEYCSTQRKYDIPNQTCGMDGNWFERKPPSIIQRILHWLTIKLT